MQVAVGVCWPRRLSGWPLDCGLCIGNNYLFLAAWVIVKVDCEKPSSQ